MRISDKTFRHHQEKRGGRYGSLDIPEFLTYGFLEGYVSWAGHREGVN